MEQYKSPFEGEPLTTQSIDDNGNMTFTVTARALTPLRARIADAVAGLIVGYAVLVGIAVAVHANDPWAFLFFGGSAIACRKIIHRWVAAEFEKQTVMIFTGDGFAVKRGLFGTWESFDRRHNHRFALVHHDQAHAEQREHEHEHREDQMKRRVVFRKPYYQDSYIVSFEYLGQRNDLMAVYGRPDALAILARLKACDEVMEAQSRNGRGVPMTPAEEWGDQPGTIPETV